MTLDSWIPGRTARNGKRGPKKTKKTDLRMDILSFFLNVFLVSGILDIFMRVTGRCI